MTSDSPSTVGSVATRTSSMRPAAAAFSEMRPSCGLRRSAMSSFASTFRRVVTPGMSRFGMRCISCSTPSMRNRTTSASSCGSKWMSEAPSSAAWKRIELTSRTSGTSETPSSASRSVTSSLLLGRARSPPPRRPRRGRRTPRRRERACGSRRGCPRAKRRRARADAGSRAEARRARAGSPDRRRRRAASVLERVRDRADALEHVQRQLRAASSSTPVERQVDERQLVPGGEHPRDAFARSDALLDERGRERAASAARGRERGRACPRGRASSRRAGRSRARPTRSRRTAWTGARRPARSRACRRCEATEAAVPARCSRRVGGCGRHESLERVIGTEQPNP